MPNMQKVRLPSLPQGQTLTFVNSADPSPSLSTPSSEYTCTYCHAPVLSRSWGRVVRRLGIPGSFFCDQECFKKNWVRFPPLLSIPLRWGSCLAPLDSQHTSRSTHTCSPSSRTTPTPPRPESTVRPFLPLLRFSLSADGARSLAAKGIPLGMAGYKWTGTLRPKYPLSAKREVPAHIPRPDYADHRERLLLPRCVVGEEC